MKISIITATYNSARTIKDTVLSVQKQNYKNIEHIIIDGASTDSTLNILKSSGHIGPVVTEADEGIYHAMNKGLSIASGDIVGILNSDDFYHSSDVLERIVSVFESEKCDAIYGDLVFVDKNEKSKIVRRWISGEYNPRQFFKGWMPPHPTFYVRREVYNKYGTFNLQLKNSSDYELLLRFLLLKQIKVRYIPGIMVHMRTGGWSNRSLINRLKAHKEDYMAWRYIGVSPKWFTLALKPLRKISQFKNFTLTNKNKKSLTNSIFTEQDAGITKSINRSFSFLKSFF